MSSSQLKRPLTGANAEGGPNSSYPKKHKAPDGRGVAMQGNSAPGGHGHGNSPYRKNDFSHRPKPANHDYSGRPRNPPSGSNYDRNRSKGQRSQNSSNRPRWPLPPLPEIRDPELQRLPFIHSSSVDGQTDWHSRCYEGLEWFGDSVLHFVATKIIAKDFDHFSAGQKSTVREALVCNSTLREYSQRYNFPSKIVHATPGIERTSKWPKIEADIFEAYVGAIYKDDPENGEARIRDWMLELWKPILSENRNSDNFQDVSQAKTKLAALLGGVGIKITYEDVPSDSRDEMKQAVYLTGWGFENLKMGVGAAKSKKNAGGAAALDAMNNLNWLTPGGPGEQIAQAVVAKRKFDAEKRAQREREETEKAFTDADTPKGSTKSGGPEKAESSEESEEE
ncbi:ribonuclease III domain-containing protein [Phyllosticta citribraziliensis]